MSELTKYWTAPGATLFLEEPTPQTFIPRWGWSFPGEAVYKAADVEALLYNPQALAALLVERRKGKP